MSVPVFHATINAKTLRHALTLSRRSTCERRATLPSLGWVRLELDGAQLALETTDLEAFSRYAIGAGDSYGAGSVCVDAKRLAQALKGRKGDVNLSFDQNRCPHDHGVLIVSQNGTALSIPLEDGEQFPSFPEPSCESDETGKCRADLFADALRSTLYAASRDESKYNLNGLHFYNIEGGATPRATRIESTDGHRMAWCDIPEVLPEGIYPRTACSALLAELGKRNPLGDTVEFVRTPYGQGDIVRVSVGSWVLMVRLVVGEYPDTDQIRDDSRNPRCITLTLPTRELEIACQAAVNNDSRDKPKESPTLFETLENGETRITAKHAGLSTDIAGETSSAFCWPNRLGEDPLRFAVNARYLLGALESVGTDTVRFQMSEPEGPKDTRPCVLTPLHIQADGWGEVGPQAIVMPMRA